MLTYKTLRPLGQVSRFVLLSVLALCMVAPFLWMLSTALKRGPDVFTPIPSLLPMDRKTGALYFTLENFDYVLRRKGFGTAFVNNLFVVGVVVPLKLFLNILAAYAFARIPFPGRERLFRVMLASLMVPGVALLIPRVQVTQLLGMYDSLWGLILPMAVAVIDIFLLRQFFLTLPYELEEAAMMDGAGRFRTLWTIMVPLSYPAIAVVTISSFIFHWNDLTWPLVIISNPARYTLPLALALLTGNSSNQPYYTMAGATLATIPVVLVFLIFQRRILQGISMTGIKG